MKASGLRIPCKEHVCENTTPCYGAGMKSCVNKWGNYWCECQEGWYGKDCDHIDADGTFKCMNENGCRHTFGSAPVQTIEEAAPEVAEQTSKYNHIATINYNLRAEITEFQ